MVHNTMLNIGYITEINLQLVDIYSQVNPDPDANDDAEIDIVKQIFAHNNDSPTAPEIPAKFPDDSSIDFYDEEESTGGSCTSSCKDTKPHHDARNRFVSQ